MPLHSNSHHTEILLKCTTSSLENELELMNAIIGLNGIEANNNSSCCSPVQYLLTWMDRFQKYSYYPLLILHLEIPGKSKSNKTRTTQMEAHCLRCTFRCGQNRCTHFQHQRDASLRNNSIYKHDQINLKPKIECQIIIVAFLSNLPLLAHLNLCASNAWDTSDLLNQKQSLLGN